MPQACVRAAFQSLDAAATPNSAARQQCCPGRVFNQANSDNFRRPGGSRSDCTAVIRQPGNSWSAQAAALTARYNQLEEKRAGKYPGKYRPG
ncbi:hypothetical protein WDV93_16475 [Pantoea ananatis]